MYQILTQEPTTIEADKTLVYFRRKDTKKITWKESDKFRGVIVPSYVLPIAYHETTKAAEVEGQDATTEVSQAEDVFQDAIKDAFLNAASLILKEYVDVFDKDTQLDEEALSFESVLARMQKEQTSQRLNQAMIEAAYDGSKTHAASIARYEGKGGEKKVAALRSHYLSLASNNSGIMPELASKMIAYIEADDLSDSTNARNSIFAALVKKLEVLSKRDTSDDL